MKKLFWFFIIIITLVLAIFYKLGARDWSGVRQVWETDIVLSRPKYDKLAFIRDGNVWTINQDGSHEKQLTNHQKFIIDVNKQKSCLENNCGIYDPETWYNRDYYDKLSLSPSGEFLAVMSYTDKLREIILTEDPELRNEYLAGPYWIPAHHDLNIINIETGDIKIIPLENNPLDKSERVEKIYWDKLSSRVVIMTIDGNIFSINRFDNKITKSNHRVFAPDSLHQAYSLSLDSLIFWDYSVGSPRDPQILVLPLWDVNRDMVKLSKFSGQSRYNDIVSGTDGKVFFWTEKDGSKILSEYHPRSGNYRLLLTRPSCRGDKVIEGCIALTYKYGALDSSRSGAISPTGKYFFGSINVKIDEGRPDGIYRVSDIQKMFTFGKEHTSIFNWGLDGESLIVLRHDGNLDYISLTNGSAKSITTGGGITDIGGFDWNYLN